MRLSEKLLEGQPIGAGTRVKAVVNGKLVSGAVSGEDGDNVFIPNPDRPADRPMRVKRKDVALDDDPQAQAGKRPGQFSRVGGKQMGLPSVGARPATSPPRS